jgi:hypothetical protein
MFIYRREGEEKARQQRKTSEVKEVLKRSVEDDGPSVMSIRKLNRTNTSKRH